MIRQCSRPACGGEAAATLTYSHRGAVAWLGDLAAEREPHAYDLCGHHADGVRVPQGWRLDDRRGAATVGRRLAG